MEIVSGLLMGLIGSLHCLGMCGPLVLAIPGRNEKKSYIIADSILYNSGRIFTYIVLGTLVGLIGSSIRLAGYQEIISITAGVILLIVVLIPKKFENKISAFKPFHYAGEILKSLFGKILRKKSHTSVFFIGNLNGLLPCGLVYSALVASIAYGSVSGAATFMLFFGLGTLPMLASVFIIKSVISVELKRKINRLVPAGIAMVAVLLILRGLSLNIPYISPSLPEQVKEKPHCCCEE